MVEKSKLKSEKLKSICCFFYVTKDNIEEFIEEYQLCAGYHSTYTLTYFPEYARLKCNYETCEHEFKSWIWDIPFDVFMVYDYCFWKSYTKEEFYEEFEINY